MNKRNVIALSTAGVENNASTQCNWITTALCDDGSMWWLRDNDTEWRELPPIPQSTVAAVEKERDRYLAALRFIAENGGKNCKDNDGTCLTCNGSWCAEQARAALAKETP